MINDNKEFARSIIFMFFKLDFKRRKKFLATLDNAAYWSFVNDNNNSLNKCFEVAHDTLSSDENYIGGYHPDYFSFVDNDKLWVLRQKFINLFDDDYKTEWKLDQMYFDLCKCTLEG